MLVACDINIESKLELEYAKASSYKVGSDVEIEEAISAI